jgi:hypothetical protein
LNQIEIERKFNQFNRSLNALKDSSIMKKSKDQRREIYLELERQKEEQRKKDEEEKQKAADKS